MAIAAGRTAQINQPINNADVLTTDPMNIKYMYLLCDVNGANMRRRRAMLQAKDSLAMLAIKRKEICP